MKTIAVIIVCALLATAGSAQTKNPLKTTKDTVSYGIGLEIGKNFKRQEVSISVDAFMRGIKDGMGSGPSAIPDVALQSCMESFGKEMMAKQAAKSRAVGDANRKAGETYLSANKKKEGVVVLPDGIQYRIIKAGSGEKPSADKTVVCHYRGTLVDGKEFDSSYSRGEPAEFPIANVIKGWQEILVLMPVGSKWEVVIPSELAYGEQARGDVIGPNSTLVFEIELLSIK
jgi:FKBP-type peptidyl-prolyl cis-trans isomerase FklB